MRPSRRSDAWTIKKSGTDAPALLRPQRQRASASPALASLLGETARGRARRRAARTAPLRAEGQASHLSVPVRRAVADGSVRLQAAPDGIARAPTCRSPSGMGQRLTGMSAAQASFPVVPSKFQVRAARQSPARGSASCCRTRRRSSTICRFIKSMYTEAINHDPAVTFFQTGSQIAGRPSIGSWLSYGLGSENAGSAGLRRHDLARAAAARRPAAVRPPLGQRLSADAIPGREVPLRRRPGAVPLEPAGLRRRRRRRRTWMPSSELNEDEARGVRRSRRSPRASRNTRWRSACRRRCRS